MWKLGETSMQHIIGLVPDDGLRNRIISFQKRWKGNQIVDIVEPHITVKAQGGLSDGKEWLQAVSRACASFSPFTVRITKPSLFGEDVLYLAVESEAVYEIHNLLVSVISPGKDLLSEFFEDEKYTPHITLGMSSLGVSRDQIQDMMNSAEKEFSAEFAADYLRIYREDNLGRYHMFRDVPLGSG